MTATTASRRRAFSGPAILSAGFRPFFLVASLWAALTVGLWVPWLLGHIAVPSALAPVTWHAHELVFGFGAAVIAGFLLTAVPNWTGRLPVTGGPLAMLVGLWLLGRAAIALSAWIGAAPALGLALVFPLALVAVMLREVLASGNRRNLPVVGLVGLLATGQAVAMAEILVTGHGALGPRVALGAVVLLILLIGGRITPSFTSSWLRRRGATALPAPFDRLDLVALLTGSAAVLGWIILPLVPAAGIAVGALMIAAGVLTLWRAARWRPLATGTEPLVAVLHLAYAFVPVGLLLGGAAVLAGDAALATAGLHAWSTGAVGMMTLAVMTRASLGHTGRALHAGASITALYALAALAAVMRLGAALWPGGAATLLELAAIAWVLAFLGYACLFARALLMPRPDGSDHRPPRLA